jgi:hypothetical protein
VRAHELAEQEFLDCAYVAMRPTSVLLLRCMSPVMTHLRHRRCFRYRNVMKYRTRERQRLLVRTCCLLREYASRRGGAARR